MFFDEIFAAYRHLREVHGFDGNKVNFWRRGVGKIVDDPVVDLVGRQQESEKHQDDPHASVPAGASYIQALSEADDRNLPGICQELSLPSEDQLGDGVLVFCRS